MKRCPCAKKDFLPRILQGPVEAKHYLSFPNSVKECKTSEECKRLRHYVSCPGIIRNLTSETRNQARTFINDSQYNLANDSVVLLQGGREDQWNYYQSDTLMCVFKQEQFFRYLFGVNIPDCYGIFDVASQKFYAFIPEMPASVRPYLGAVKDNKLIKEEYGLDDVMYVSEMKGVIEKISPSIIYLLHGTNDDSKLETRNTPDMVELGLDKYNSDSRLLYPILAESRVYKTQKEQDMLRVCCYISSIAHCVAMRETEVGVEELYHEAIFKSVTGIVGGARNVAYTCICGSGVNGAILHYGHAEKPNDRILEDGDMLLHDMGGIFPNGYVSDITVSYPANKKFNKQQRDIYNIVYKSNRAVHAQARIGSSWIDMHKLSETVILEGLVEIGILKGDVSEMLEKRVSAYFMPHGLGHLIGLDTHDCGAHIPVVRAAISQEAGLKNLRCTRTLADRMFTTIEPGLYFIDYLLKELKEHPDHSKYVVISELDKYMTFGGVRIEDDVMINEHGVDDYTVVPRTVDEIEEFFDTCSD